MSNTNWKEEFKKEFTLPYNTEKIIAWIESKFLATPLKEKNELLVFEVISKYNNCEYHTKENPVYCLHCVLKAMEEYAEQFKTKEVVKEASLPVEQVKNFMAHAYFQGALDRAEKKASEVAFNNWYSLNKDAFSLNQKEENNISQLQEVSPASVVSLPCTDGNSIEQERKWKRHFRKWFDDLNHWPKAEEIENYLQERGIDRWLANEELRKGITSINKKYKELSTENKILKGEIPPKNNQGSADERSVATEDARGDGDGNKINPK